MKSEEDIVLSSKKIEADFVTISFIKPRVVWVNFKKDCTINVETGIKILSNAKQIIGKEDLPYLSLIDLKDLYVPITEFAKLMFGQFSPEKDLLLARAVVSTNLAQRIEMQNFIGLHKPLVPTKLFMHQEEALAWLDFHLEEYNKTL